MRRKNVVSTMMACAAIMGLSVVMWVLFGYSLSLVEIMQELLEISGGLDCMELK